MKILSCTAIMLALATPLFAQDNPPFDAVESDEFGEYLVDAEGRPLYVFSADTPMTDEQPVQVACLSTECLADWSLVVPAIDSQPSADAETHYVGTAQYNEQNFSTYRGWPLYYFAGDEGADLPQGHRIESFGGVWRIAATAGVMVPGVIDAGETLYADGCAQCHGRTGRGMASFPSIKDKTAERLVHLLAQYRSGIPRGPNSALMWPVAAELSDQEIADLAEFVSESF